MRLPQTRVPFSPPAPRKEMSTQPKRAKSREQREQAKIPCPRRKRGRGVFSVPGAKWRSEPRRHNQTGSARLPLPRDASKTSSATTYGGRKLLRVTRFQRLVEAKAW